LLILYFVLCGMFQNGTYQLPLKRLLQYTLPQGLCLLQTLADGFFYFIANGEFARSSIQISYWQFPH